MIVALPPFDIETAAIENDCCPAIGETAACRGDHDGTRRCTAGKRDARAAFPNTQADDIAPAHFGKADIRPLREDRMMFKHRTKACKIVSLNFVDKEDAMRIAHIDRAWSRQHRCVDGPDLQLKAPCVE